MDRSQLYFQDAVAHDVRVVVMDRTGDHEDMLLGYLREKDRADKKGLVLLQLGKADLAQALSLLKEGFGAGGDYLTLVISYQDIDIGRIRLLKCADEISCSLHSLLRRLCRKIRVGNLKGG